jgi:hypothetical protein
MFADSSVSPGGPYDGIVTLNSAQAFQFTRPPSSGFYDALRSTEHEIDEILGLGSSVKSFNDLRPQDLFSWSSVDTRNISDKNSRYFSIDSGNTEIVSFNQSSSGDYGDWLSASCPQANPYVQNAFSCADQFSDVTTTSPEGINLDVIGYDLVSSHAAPIANSATNITSSGFTANWNGVGGATGYRLDVSTSSSFSNYVSGFQDLDAGNVTSRAVSGLSPSMTYYYRVRAANGAGTSGNSNVITTETIAAPTPTPTPTPTPSPTPSPTPVQGPTPKISNVPAAITAEATGPAGSVVGFSSPTASDAQNNNVPVICIPASGSTFPIAVTPVICTAASQGAIATASFNVTVQDTTAPVITVPPNMKVKKQKQPRNQPQGAKVEFSPAPSATDIVDGAITPITTPPSGSFLPMGSTSVAVTATDSHGNSATKSFTVSVVSKLTKKKHR